MSISVEIESVYLPKRTDAHDVYRPVLYRYASDAKHATTRHAQHLDIIKTWRDLDYRHAEEICFWEAATKAALESYLEEKLITLFVAAEKDIGNGATTYTNRMLIVKPDDLPALHTLYRMRNFVNSLGRRRLEFPLRCLTDFMTGYHSAYGSRYQWLLNITDAHVVLGNYLRTFDFFDQDDLGNCIIEMDLVGFITNDGFNCADETQSAYNLRIVGMFRNCPHTLRFAVQSQNVIHPWLKEPVLDLNVPIFNTAMQFKVVHDTNGRTTVTQVKHFPDHVRLERTIRLEFAAQIELNRLDPASKPSPAAGKSMHDKAVQQNSSKRQRSSEDPLRAISSGSVRVQGTGVSAFERSAKVKHGKVYEAHTIYQRENVPSRENLFDHMPRASQFVEQLPLHRQSIDDLSHRTSTATAASTAFRASNVSSSTLNSDVTASSSSSHDQTPCANARGQVPICAVPRGSPKSRYNAHREENLALLSNPSPATAQVWTSMGAKTKHSPIGLNQWPNEMNRPNSLYPSMNDALRSDLIRHDSSMRRRQFIPKDSGYASLHAIDDLQTPTQSRGCLNIPYTSFDTDPRPNALRGQDMFEFDQAQIQRNYNEFLNAKASGLTNVEQDEVDAIQDAFLRTDASNSDQESSSDNLWMQIRESNENSCARGISKPERSNRASPRSQYMSRDKGKYRARPNQADSSPTKRLKHTQSQYSVQSPTWQTRRYYAKACDAAARPQHRSQTFVSPTSRGHRPVTRDEAALREGEDDLHEVEDGELEAAGLHVFDLARQPTDYVDYDDCLDPEWY